ncbi:DUF6088 family protein [Chryseobacterium sp. TY3]|jgi:hypothetical protein|uniref:type IV toxin-antitoxin system AbiEi family antitoxin domain-containing protein n=1 Tax=Elizabethkingia miricola TaxID=172045 RepID=UPI000C15229D|nr:DUF6088 family protein [Elizabethkingia miricola]PSL86938.1 hypothetical protein C7V10_18035 [Elizabethkingia miricola]QHQ86181.1 hypothetical protein FE632_05045 [Elizabethkingia miricola]WNG66143.1 DUF6088 family protein [Elizabethkingia miricola]
MKTSDYIVNTINRFPKGFVFTYEEFSKQVESKEAIIKALNRMAVSGKIEKLAKGKFYKPEETVFGKLEPPKQQIVKDLLEENGKVVGYLTGLSIYNEQGLTTQVSNTIQIGKNEIRPTFKRGRFTISFIKQKNTITKENIPFLQILDAINQIKKIPDTSLDESVLRIIEIIKTINEAEISTMQRLALKYPPSTRALLGAVLEFLKIGEPEILKKSLNAISTYSFPNIETILPTSKNWNIK